MTWSDPSSSGVQAWKRAVVHGPQVSYYLTSHKPAGIVVGASFRPGAAGAVLGVPGRELAGGHVLLEDLWGAFARDLHERLLEASGPHDALPVLDHALRTRLRTPLLLHPAVAYALRGDSTEVPSVARIAAETGYSTKQLIARFRDAVGLTPGSYQRVRRFAAVLQRIAGEPLTPLAVIAADAGYADQAHLTRTFRELAGVTPRRYRPRDAQNPHHHVVPSLPR
jgi:AraC-like DNA-binding protein